MVVILILAAVTVGAAVFLMSSRKRDTGDARSVGGGAPALRDRPPPPPPRAQPPSRPPPSPQPQAQPPSAGQDPVVALVLEALNDTRGRAVPRVSTPRLTWLHIFDSVHPLYFVATLGRRALFAYRPLGNPPDEAAGVIKELDEDGSSSGAFFDELAGRVLNAGLPGLPSPRAQEAFQPHTLRTPSIHIRALFEDGRTWQGMYTAEDVERQGLPVGLLELLLGIRATGMTLLPEKERAMASLPPMRHFIIRDKVTLPGSETEILVHPEELAMLPMPLEDGRTAKCLIAHGDPGQFVQTLSSMLEQLIPLHRIPLLERIQYERARVPETCTEADFMVRILFGEGTWVWATVLDPADIQRGLLSPNLAAFARDVRLVAASVMRSAKQARESAA